MILALALPLYNNFITNITYNIPYANTSQEATVYQTQTKQRYQWYNNEKIIDISVIYADSYKYMRTEKDVQSCYFYKGGERVDFVPSTADPWQDMGEKSLFGMKVHHFRLIGDDEGRRFEQNFYTKADSQFTPIRWEMNSISNFHSHFDIYIIDYNSFEVAELSDSVFEIPSTIPLSRPCYATPQDENTPAGPTFRGRKSANFRQNFDDKSVQFEQIDWRFKGVTAVKDQAFCGSCWAFSAASTLESRINVKLIERGDNEPFVVISPQEIVDCYWNFTGDVLTQSCGCEGGDENAVLSYWNRQGVVYFTEEKDYPYVGQNDYCKTVGKRSVNVTHYKTVPANDVDALKRALMGGPVSIGISVTESLITYTGGIYRDKACSSDPDQISHAVNLVGWGVTEEFEEYWIVKNSWSPKWGADGYIYIAIADNICSVMSIAAYVEVEL